MAMIRPSLTLVLDLDERVAGEETILEIKRSYAHITTPIIRVHAAAGDDAPARNVARLLVSMGAYAYLRSSDEGADGRWASVVEPWIGNILHKVGNNMKVFNDRQRENGMPELVFDCADVELQGGALVVGLHPDPLSWLDPGLNVQVGLVRTLLNDGMLNGAVRVDVPSDASWKEQRAGAWDTWAAGHPEAVAAMRARETVAAEGEAAGASEPEKTREEFLREDAKAKSYENTAVPPTDSPVLPHATARDLADEGDEVERFSFVVDYSIWDVLFADGTKRTFDSKKRCFLDDSGR